jgi:hypothetical protein
MVNGWMNGDHLNVSICRTDKYNVKSLHGKLASASIVFGMIFAFNMQTREGA